MEKQTSGFDGAARTGFRRAPPADIQFFALHPHPDARKRANLGAAFFSPYAMSNTTNDEQQKAGPRGLLKQLQEKYAVFRDFQPLAIGIDKQIIAAIPEVDRKTLRIALGIHTGSNPYLKRLKESEKRYTLDGAEGGEVSEEHRTHAKTVLAERRKKAIESRKAVQAAEEAAEAERRRAEKLAQLAAKFSSPRR